jgi:hypothetical protein
MFEDHSKRSGPRGRNLQTVSLIPKPSRLTSNEFMLALGSEMGEGEADAFRLLD